MSLSNSDLLSEAWRPLDFERQHAVNLLFWSRFAPKPDLRGKVILDLGCGHGRLCLDMAEDGAQKVVGLDIDQPKIEFARRNISLRHPEWQPVVSFVRGEIDAMPDNTFDLVVSKDTFEHVHDLPGLLRGIRRCLNPGGRLYAGFGPLYNSPKGHHLWPHGGLPWGHLLIPHAWLLFWVNLMRKDPFKSLCDFEKLNELAFADYEKIFIASGFDIISFRVNQSESVISKIMTLLRRIALLREYCTHNIYFVACKI